MNPYAVTLLDGGAVAWREADVPLPERGVRLGWPVNFVRSLHWEVNAPRQKRHREQSAAAEQAGYQRRAALYGPWDNIPEPEPVHVERARAIRAHDPPWHLAHSCHVFLLGESLEINTPGQLIAAAGAAHTTHCH